MNIPELAKELIEHGIVTKAQDLYILPKRKEMTLTFRYGEEKSIYQSISYELADKLIFHFKFLGQMDVGEKRKPQVGAVNYLTNHLEQRLRLSTVGDHLNRESLVIRFLHQFGSSPEYYFFPKQLIFIEQQMKKRGLFLFCGPVGSGKTTLMYKLAKQKETGKQVITIEDPVEIQEESFLQLQTNEKINMSYDQLIKLCLRHRPDILIIGEIRDEKTAKAAIRAALTGHTVFATLHARSVLGVKERLRELGIPTNEILACLQGIIYQQLIQCSKQRQTKAAILFDYEFFYQAYDQKQWQKLLRKVWAYGFIDQQIYEQFIQ